MMGHEMRNGSQEMMMGGSHGMMDGMGTAFVGSLLLAALFLFAVVAGAILLVRALWKPQHQAPQVNNAAGTPRRSRSSNSVMPEEISTTTSSTDDGGRLGRLHDGEIDKDEY